MEKEVDWILQIQTYRKIQKQRTGGNERNRNRWYDKYCAGISEQSVRLGTE
jgi:hypothetical protein